MDPIQINERFRIEHTETCWVLHDRQARWNNRYRDVRVTDHQSFYGTLFQACLAVLDRSAGTAQSVAEILDLLPRAAQDIRDALSTPGTRHALQGMPWIMTEADRRLTDSRAIPKHS